MIDHETNQPTPARFSLVIDGKDYTPDAVGKNGMRFVSIHAGRKQRFTFFYSRGSGIVEVPLPTGAQRGTVHIAKGLEYLPARVTFWVAGESVELAVTLHRWTDVRSKGWLCAEEHLHYDRIDPAHDRDWLTILAGDDLIYGHFLVLKGGNLTEVWATQYAYGEEGRASDGDRLICPGEEYRDIMQGHINLLGISEVIPPIRAGTADHPYNYPTLYNIVRNSEPVDAEIKKSKNDNIYQWRISQRMRIMQSCWLAARGEGVAKNALRRQTRITQNTIAHTGVVRVLIGDEQIKSAEDAAFLIKHLRNQIELYQSRAKYKSPQDRDRALDIFRRAINNLERQLD